MDNERLLAEKLADLRWGAEWACSRCGHRKRYQLKARPRVFECATCGKQQSVTAGTVIHGMRLSLSIWFAAVKLFATESGISTRGLARRLALPVKTAFQLLHRLRKALDLEDEALVGVVGGFAGWLKSTRRPRKATRVGAFFATDRARHLFLGLGPRATLEALAACSPEADLAACQTPTLWMHAKHTYAYVHFRLKETYRQVSHRYLQRYVRAAGFLWRRIVGGPRETHEDRELDFCARAVIRRCMLAERQTFAALQPALP